MVNLGLAVVIAVLRWARWSHCTTLRLIKTFWSRASWPRDGANPGEIPSKIWFRPKEAEEEEDEEEEKEKDEKEEEEEEKENIQTYSDTDEEAEPYPVDIAVYR